MSSVTVTTYAGGPSVIGAQVGTTITTAEGSPPPKVLLLEAGATVPVGTPVGTLIFEKGV